MSSERQVTPIPLCVPWMTGTEGSYLAECVDTNWVSSAGPFVTRFEKMMADYVGTGHAVATVNGTAALHLSLLIAGVRPGDAVITSTLTFVATANAIRHAGAWPIFVDVDPASWQIDAGRLADFLRRDCRPRDGALCDSQTGRPIAALLPVHILGHPADMDPILGVAREFDLPVIEDATESLGATYKGRRAGALGDVAALSFNGNKLITCGGGGMVVTAHPDWAERARHLTMQAHCHPVESWHDEVAFNYRLTNVQAAIGCAQMEAIEARLAAKRRIADFYRSLCAEVPGLAYMPQAAWASAVFWLSTVLVDPATFGRDCRQLLTFLAGRGIGTRPLWQPLHLSPAHRGARSVGGGVAEDLYAKALSLPSSCGLTEEEKNAVRSAIIAASAISAA
jgi:perosamine synthetase